jgi:hypothetical protein
MDFPIGIDLFKFQTSAWSASLGWLEACKSDVGKGLRVAREEHHAGRAALGEKSAMRGSCGFSAEKNDASGLGNI